MFLVVGTSTHTEKGGWGGVGDETVRGIGLGRDGRDGAKDRTRVVMIKSN